MSNRQMKRLRKQLKEQEAEGSSSNPSESSSDLEEATEEAKGPSVFAAFNDDSSESSNSSSEEEEDIPQSKPIAHRTDAAPLLLPTAEHQDDDALLEQAIAQSKSERTAASAHGEEAGMESIFEVNEADLNSDYELMKQLQAADHAKERESGSSRNVGRNNRKTVRTTFCTPEKDWAPLPSFVSGASVARQICVDEEGFAFTFEASEAYMQGQALLETYRNAHDPNLIVEFLHEYPYNVDAMLILSQVCLQTSQLERGEWFLRRALFAIQSFLHPRFVEKAVVGQARLVEEEKEQEEGKEKMGGGEEDKEEEGARLNDTFRNALFRAVILNDKRGCKHTAFAMSKLLLGLNPGTDPSNVLVLFDQLALKAHAAYLLQLRQPDKVKVFGINHGLHVVLPNFAYSNVLALCQEDDTITAKEAAVQALALYPGVFIELYEKLVAEKLFNANDFAEQALGRVKSIQGLTGVDLTALYRLYATRMFTLWNNPIPALFNKSGIQWLVDLTNSGVDLVAPAAAIQLTEADKLLQERYSKITNFANDDTGVIQLVDEAELPNQRQTVRGRLRDQVANLGLNDLALFLQTLAPNVRLPTATERENQQEGGG